MSASNESKYLRQLGARILCEANDLKRTPEALASELGVDLDFVTGVIEGNQEFSSVRDFIWKMAEFYPISLADLWLEIDDTVDGALIMDKAASTETARIFERPDTSGALMPYYEYRDTAMSRLAPFKSEWIKELRFVENNDPHNSDVAFNKGHLMHQMTFFIGAVNFYWEVDGERYCVEMNTGDSCFITPFVPHSFAGRDETAPALIIAATFAGDVRRAISEIVQMGTPAVENLAGDLRDISGYAQRLSASLNAESLSSDDLKQHLVEQGIVADRASELANGEIQPSQPELVTLAVYLNLRPVDLNVPSLQASGEVTINYAEETNFRAFPSGDNNGHQIKPLARTSLQPYLKGFDIRISSGDKGEFCHGLHEYVYNYGDQSITVFWGNGDAHQSMLRPGDSAYFQPMTPHRFECADGAEGSLVCVRIPGRLSKAVLDEYASFPKAIRQRVAEETTRWF
ncbi:MAG TPA: hypothetical protein EYG51_11170 [Pseudomonadales bacterium]|nr:hypothetical protein [Pseudomonadales bacterium]